MALIELRDIRKIYDLGEVRVEALRGVSLSMEKGEFVAVMGPSGSGKSTLMNILGCLDVPSSGSYLLDGRDVSNMGKDDLAQVRGQFIGFVGIQPAAQVFKFSMRGQGCGRENHAGFFMPEILFHQWTDMQRGDLEGDTGIVWFLFNPVDELVIRFADQCCNVGIRFLQPAKHSTKRSQGIQDFLRQGFSQVVQIGVQMPAEGEQQVECFRG